jgi:DnaJ-class molecular chaperone
MEEDYYKILGVKRNASDAEIQKAYRALARKYHPDVNPDDKKAKQKFQNIQKAYDVLKDPQKREMYDRYGSSFESAGAAPGGGPWHTHTTGGPGGFGEFDFSQLFGGRGGDASAFESFGDAFRQFAGGGQARQSRSTRRRPARGNDLRHELQVPFQTAVSGGEARLSVHRPDGRVETITAKIPEGIEDGQTIRLRGQGEPSLGGGEPGDLLITVRVAPHPCFVRHGNDLEVLVPVSLAEAAAGAKVDVPTPRGVIALKIPPATSSGKRLRVKGHGVTSRDGKPGDLYAIVQIVLPETIDERSLDFFREFERRSNLRPREGLQW